MNEEQIVIVDGARTPIGSFGGVFKDVPAHELGATAAAAALARAGVAGRRHRRGGDGLHRPGRPGRLQRPPRRPGRRTADADVPAYTVNRLCGSGLQAVWSAAMEMRWNGLDFALAGGDESMTRMPFYDFGARNGYKLGNRTLVDGTVMMLTDPFHGIHMGVTAENVARKYGVSRAGAGRVRRRVPAPRGDRRGGEGRVRRGDRRRSRSAAAAVHRRGRRAPQARHHARDAGQAPPRFAQGRHGHRRQRLRASTTARRRWCWPASRPPPSAG